VNDQDRTRTAGGTTKIVAVVGATGAQGGGLARAILADEASAFTVRALTRHGASASAVALARSGAEVVHADLDRLDTLKQAFDGAHAVFCMTNFWEHESPERELAQATAMATAAACTGVRHVIWSTLEDTRRFVPLDSDRMPTLRGHYKVPHFDAKGEANAEFVRRGVPVTCLLTSFYWDNYISFPGMGLSQNARGTLTIRMPMGSGRLPGIAAEDIGRCAYGVLAGGERYLGETVGIAGEHLTGAEIAAALSRAIARPVEYDDIAPDAYRRLDFRGADDLGNMFQFKRDFQDAFCAARSVARSRALNPRLQTFEQWLGANAHRIAVR
jgi:uncharacterized protein YbjT (DUF2867 family)